MRVRIITSGSQGDVRPYVALGVGLRSAGHDVRVIAHAGFEGLVRKRGLGFAPIAGDPREAADADRLRGVHQGGHNPFRWWRALHEVEAPLLRQRLRECWEGCHDADAIVVSMLPYLFGYALAQKLNVPLVRAFYYPVSPTRSSPIGLLPPWLSLGGRFNLGTYHVQRQLLWEIARPWLAQACRDVWGAHTLPRREPFGDLDRQQRLLLYGYSPAVAPPPADWGSWQAVTGYWFLDRTAEWTPPLALAAFLADGPPPVCVGFGSMTFDRDEIVETVSRALAASGQRGVLLAGWGSLRPPELPKNMISVDWAPLTWLFPRMAAVVHHGGAGTTADGLRAGVPTVVVPFFYDQFFWASRVHALGVGPRPIPRKRLTAHSLAHAIQVAVGDHELRRRAGLVGARIQAEDGVGQAVAAFERHVGRSNSKPSPAPAASEYADAFSSTHSTPG